MARDNHEQLMSAILKLTGELGEMKSDVKNIKDDVVEIKEQTIKTNGRVNKVEAFIENWKAKVGLLVSLFSLGWLFLGDWIKGKLGL